jgi:uncharacterized protein involved in exopolysaccharide biosynthesis
MRPQVTASPDNIDPMSLFHALRSALPRLMLGTLFVFAVTYGVLTLIAPRFQSEAQLTIDAKSTANPFSDPKQSQPTSDSTANQMDREAINTHIKSRQSPTLASKIVTDLKLKDKPEFNSELGDIDMLGRLLRLAGLGGARPGQTEQDRVLEAYFRNCDVYSARESRFIGIRCTSADRQLAADIANAIAEAYREQLADRKVEETKDVQDALLPKIEQMKLEVSTADVAVEQFRAKTDLFKAGTQKTTLNEQQLGELTNELSRAQAARSESDARARSAQEMLRGGSGDALPDVQKSPLIQALVQQRVRVERQVAELNATLLPGHPRMLQLNADLAGLKKQIGAEAAKIVDGLSKEAKVAADRETAIRKRLAELKVTVKESGPDEAKLKELEADSKSKRDELERLLAQYNVNKSRAGSKSVPVEAKILSAAMPSSVPVYPKKPQVASIAALAAFILGMAITALRALASGAQTAPAARAAGAFAPTLEGAHSKPARWYKPSTARVGTAEKQPSEFAAKTGVGERPTAMAVDGQWDEQPEPALRSADELTAYILVRTPTRGGYRTLVVGRTPAVDATPVAVDLARDLANADQPIVLVEWTYEPPKIAIAADGLDGPGLAELMGGGATFEDVITALPGSEAHFIPSGRMTPQLLDALNADQINLILDALDEAYAQIVIVGDHESVRHLFETIQGRCDAGVIVGDGEPPTVLSDPPGTFLGFEVTEIALVQFVPTPTASETGQRKKRGFGSVARLPSPA